MGRRRTKGVSPVPFVMGQGRDMWNAILADAHTWGGRVTVTKLSRIDPLETTSASKDRSHSTAKVCSVCRSVIERGSVIVPWDGVGRSTRWAHKSCRRNP